jgi:hypothetical protein
MPFVLFPGRIKAPSFFVFTCQIKRQCTWMLSFSLIKERQVLKVKKKFTSFGICTFIINLDGVIFELKI